MTQPAILRVAVNAPLSRLFDYLPPAGSDQIAAQALLPGCRITVPFGRQKQTALIVAHSDRSEVPRERLRQALAPIDETPVFSASDLWLIRFASDYYQHPVGEVVAAALPAPLRQGKPLHRAVKKVRITDDGAAISIGQLAKRAPKQASFLAVVQEAGSIHYEQLDATQPGWRKARKALLDKGWIALEESREGPSVRPPTSTRAGPMLNADQKAAIAAIRARPGFQVSLLDGVTGSGKTEVYLGLMQDVIAANRQVLILVPEIGLTPQLIARLAARLGEEPAVLHSGLPDSARMAAWRASRAGTARVILGTRSAIFAPMKKPGLIIVDEEHDNSLKQQEGFRYSARDLAVARAKRLAIPVILGTATPSLETLQRCKEGAYQHLRLPTRAGAAAPPLLRLVDLNRHAAADGISDPAIDAIRKTLQAGGQTLVFLNRRGFAPTLICSGCGRTAECVRCDARMTVHASSNELRCHHCGASRRIDEQCSDCGGHYRPLGQGTQRLEEALKGRFPDHTIARIDSDSVRLKGTMSKALSMATTGETRILIGTQMLSKGHHFPDLVLVVVINADQGLFSTDFRGSEKLAQSLVQVAGRAGREKHQGQVLIQTAYPDHPFWGELFGGGYERVAESALAERLSTAWPPFSRLALIRASAHKREDARAFLDTVMRLIAPQNSGDIRVLGPVSAPMERKAGRYRAQLLLQSMNRQALQRLLQPLRLQLENDRASRKVRWSIDVDPIELF
jgi:primosomal protein N' (replication factor Y) (superfamily II helicase)